MERKAINKKNNLNTMNEIVKKNSENKQPNKRSVYVEFILWTAMPPKEKERLGIETQGQFAEEYKVSEDTLTNWKKRDDFEDRVDAILKIWSTGKTPDVIYGIYRAAVKGNPFSQQLWLGYFKGYNPKKIEDDKPKVVLSPADIRHMIDQLPEQLKKEHYGYLRKLAEDIVAWRDARDSEVDGWSERPAPTILLGEKQTDPDAHDIPNTGADEVAGRYTERVCEDLERKASENNYQSAERRRQK